MPPTNCRRCWNSSASAPKGFTARSRCCCATWSGCARFAATKASAIASWPTAPPRRTTTATAPMRRRWDRSIAQTRRAKAHGSFAAAGETDRALLDRQSFRLAFDCRPCKSRNGLSTRSARRSGTSRGGFRGGPLHAGRHLVGHRALLLDCRRCRRHIFADVVDGRLDRSQGGDDVAGDAVEATDLGTDLVSGLLGLVGEALDLRGHHRKAPTSFAGAGGFDGG